MTMDHIGPYRMVERIGSGGMGEVYKARDERLDRWVAIKRIRPDKESADESRQRFRREARAAAKLNHASIVHVYDIFQDGDSDCIVMEYVEGSSLDRMIAERPLDAQNAARLGQQIASGLSEAHSKGILHRDLKTENIIVTREGQAKILDFGLAKPIVKDDLDASLTGKGQVVGTSRAMSPEYVSGDDVDHRADLFALGVLLYESITGQSPFKAHNTLATLKRVILHRQTPAHELNPAVPTELSALVDRLLEKEPDDRPQDAGEVALTLASMMGVSSSGSIERPSSIYGMVTSASSTLDLGVGMLPNRRRRRSWILAISVLLALVAGAVAAWYALRETRPQAGEALAFHERDVIILGDFENRTGQARFDDSLDLVFRIGLEQSDYARVLPQDQVRTALARMERDPADTPIDRELGIEIAQREGAKGLVIGTIVQIGDAYALSAQIIDPRNGETLFSTSATAESESQIHEKLQRVTQDIRANLGDSLAEGGDEKALAKVTTANFEALKAYSAAIVQIDQGEFREALPLLSRAVELDPEFAMARAKLGVVHRTLGDEDRSVEAFRAALANAERLTEFEELYVKGWVAWQEKAPHRMVEAWSLMRTLFPDNTDGYNNLALYSLHYLLEYEEAETLLREAFEVAGPAQRWQMLNNLGYSVLALGRKQEAVQIFTEANENRVLAAAPGLARAHLALDQHDDARALIEQAQESGLITDANLRSLRVISHADQGDFERALAVIHEGSIEASELRSPRAALSAQMTEAVLYERIGDRQAMLEVLERLADRGFALLEQDGQVFGGTSPILLLSLIGKLYARNGEVERAQLILNRIEPQANEAPFAMWRSAVRILEGEIAAAEGDWDRAGQILRNALSVLETFQGHESLARVERRAGNLDEAASHDAWMVEQRARAFVECQETCYGQSLSVLDSTQAHADLAASYAEQGRREDAIALYKQYIDRWSFAVTSQLPAWEVAREALRELQRRGASAYTDLAGERQQGR
ncbi:MAG: protein kinase [Acidobacteriota bacterium]